METLLSILLGLGLSASCGFRVFIPLLVASLAARTGHLELGPGYAWIASNTALATFAVATLLEVAGYFIPWVDNVLDAIATPAAILAGMLLTASTVTGLDPFLRWTLAIVGGGGSAAIFHGLTATARHVSSFTTGGLGNPLLATVEAAGATFLAVLAIVVPVLAVLLVAVLIYWGLTRLLFRRPARAA